MSVRARLLFFDIETTSLNASFGHALCFGYGYAGKPKRVKSLLDFPPATHREEIDAPLMRWAHRVLTDEADIVCTYYGKGFDRPFLNTRMLMSGLSPLPPLGYEHIDLYFTARHHLRLHSNRLQALSETFDCPIAKTPVSARTWLLAQRGDRRAFRYVIDHCRKDVEILEWCYQKLRPLIRQHPHVGAHDACRCCGSTHFQRMGTSISKRKGRYYRFQCTDCGAWSERGAVVA